MNYASYMIIFQDPEGEQKYLYDLIISVYRTLNDRYPCTVIYIDKYKYKDAVIQNGFDVHDSHSDGVLELLELIE